MQQYFAKNQSFPCDNFVILLEIRYYEYRRITYWRLD